MSCCPHMLPMAIRPMKFSLVIVKYKEINLAVLGMARDINQTSNTPKSSNTSPSPVSMEFGEYWLCYDGTSTHIVILLSNPVKGKAWKLLALCDRNQWSSEESPNKGPVVQSFDVLFLSAQWAVEQTEELPVTWGIMTQWVAACIPLLLPAMQP